MANTHPLIRPAAWRLKMGAASAPAIKWAGGALWAVAALMALTWLIGLIQDAFVGQLAAWVGALGSLAVIAWFALAWQALRRWFTQADALTLTWHGPVRAADPARRGREKAEGGFHVTEWQLPVQVRVVLDWQRWILLRLRTVQTDGDSREAFCWLTMPAQIDGSVAHTDVSLHQLRSLLYLPPAWITQGGAQPSSSAGQARHQPKPVASWVALVPSGSKLRSSAKPLSHSQKSSLASREMDTLFPPTELLEDALAEDHALPKGLA